MLKPSIQILAQRNYDSLCRRAEAQNKLKGHDHTLVYIGGASPICFPFSLRLLETAERVRCQSCG